MLRWLLAAATACVFVGCAPSGNDLAVLVATDMRPAPGYEPEFTDVRVVVRRGVDEVANALVPSGSVNWPSRRSTRVAFFSGLASGEYTVEVRLVDIDLARETVVVTQTRRVRITRDYVLEVVLDRRCRVDEGMSERCASTAEQDVVCLAGDCIPLSCLTDPTGPECDAQCRFDEDCARDVACALTNCEAGRCLAVPNDGRCEVGSACDVDAGCVPVTCDDPIRLFVDADGDGLGGIEQLRCPGPGLVTIGGDCDDTRADIGRCVDDAGVADVGTADVGAGCSDASSCDDGVACNGAETCVGGACRAGTSVPCDDGVACTTDTCTADGCTFVPDDAACTAGAGGRCDRITGCQYDVCDTTSTCAPVDGCEQTRCAGTTCVRESACGALEACCAGACAPVGCDDGEPCTIDACDDAAGCVHTASATCDDLDACTMGESCALLMCGGGRRVVCDDGNVCTTDTCAASTGCIYAPRTGAHDDGDSCTVGERCSDGVLVAGTPNPCDDGVGCTIDGCASGSCTHAPNDGACTALPMGTCHVTLGCQYAGGCSATTCTPASPCETAACTDGMCTRGSVCGAGVLCCSGTCCPDDGNPCTDEVCSGTACMHVPNTASCNDGNACTTGDSCSGGACAGTPMVCPGATDCLAQICVAGVCTPMARADGTTCTDGNACTTGDACAGGACAPGMPLPCDDGNDCTVDGCATGTGCTFTPRTLPVACVPDEVDACNTYRCGPGTGECVGTPITCSGGLVCCPDGRGRCSAPEDC